MRRPDVQDLIGRVRYYVDPNAGARAGVESFQAVLEEAATLTVFMKDGRALSAYADGARGYPSRPATAEDVTGKFRTCARRVLDPDRTEAAILMLKSLAQLAETRTLTDALR